MTGLFLVCIAAANLLTTYVGLVPVGFGYTATAGTALAGLTFVVRDSVQDRHGRSTALGAIVLGAFLSAVCALILGSGAGLRIAAASGIAFLVSESLDQAIYSPLRRRGYVRAAVASNVAGAIVDTFLFLSLAGFGIAGGAWIGQVAVKLLVTAVAVAAVVVARRRAVRP